MGGVVVGFCWLYWMVNGFYVMLISCFVIRVFFFFIMYSVFFYLIELKEKKSLLEGMNYDC